MANNSINRREVICAIVTEFQAVTAVVAKGVSDQTCERHEQRDDDNHSPASTLPPVPCKALQSRRLSSAGCHLVDPDSSFLNRLSLWRYAAQSLMSELTYPSHLAGFWLRQASYREQPQVTFNHQVIAELQGADGQLYAFSTFANLNSMYGFNLRAGQIKVNALRPASARYAKAAWHASSFAPETQMLMASTMAQN